MSLIEVGNTLDSILVAAKVLKTLNTDEEPAEKADALTNLALITSPSVVTNIASVGQQQNAGTGGAAAQNAQNAKTQKKQVNANFSKF